MKTVFFMRLAAIFSVMMVAIPLARPLHASIQDIAQNTERPSQAEAEADTDSGTAPALHQHQHQQEQVQVQRGDSPIAPAYTEEKSGDTNDRPSEQALGNSAQPVSPEDRVASPDPTATAPAPHERNKSPSDDAAGAAVQRFYDEQRSGKADCKGPAALCRQNSAR